MTEQDARTREAEELRAAIDAIEAVAPQPGEDEELRERIDRLTNLEDLRAAASAAYRARCSAVAPSVGTTTRASVTCAAAGSGCAAR
ncbi:hypothetical protein BFL35_09735 [Clavibacter michiganensis]|nr:hypothetical protein BFL35_09735 [Clavibacter michiganensis]